MRPRRGSGHEKSRVVAKHQKPDALLSRQVDRKTIAEHGTIPDIEKRELRDFLLQWLFNLRVEDVILNNGINPKSLFGVEPEQPPHDFVNHILYSRAVKCDLWCPPKKDASLAVNVHATDRF